MGWRKHSYGQVLTAPHNLACLLAPSLEAIKSTFTLCYQPDCREYLTVWQGMGSTVGYKDSREGWNMGLEEELSLCGP